MFPGTQKQRSTAMKKASPLVLLFVFSILSYAHSDSITKESYFRDCISQKIERYERTARLIGSAGGNLSLCAEHALARGEFYRQHKEELVQGMIDKQVREKRYAVDYFLNKTYATSQDESHQNYPTSKAE